MDSDTFDKLARRSASGISRRGSLLTLGGAALAAGLSGASGARAGKTGKKAK